MDGLLEIAERRDLPELLERLQMVCRSIHSRRGKLGDSESLLDEALSYARLGDIDEAILRLRLRSRPKFRSIEECEEAYGAAMAEKRARIPA